MKSIENTSENEKSPLSRRSFIGTTAKAVAAFYIVPRHVLGKGYTAPSDKLNIAAIGIGGIAKGNIAAVAATENIVALCDVDDVHAAKVFELYPNAKRYRDYRKMLEQQKGDIDAVIIATPDHTHAVIALDAMRMGKHLYVQKPLTYTVYESRRLAQEAKKNPKIVTCMGNQGHSSEEARLINEWIWDDAIGKVTEVQVWTNRPIWPQGISKPKDEVAVPDTLDWDLFVGPAPMRAYNPAYTPFKWRGWTDFGVGALGDMGAHLIDHAHWALNLGAPVSVEATSTTFNKESYPSATMVTYEFAARNAKLPALKMTWYDGGLMPPKPDEMPEAEAMPKVGGVLYLGTKGKLLHETYGRKPRLLPEARMQSYTKPKPTIPRIKTSHEMDWVNHCKAGTQPLSNFAYAGPLTETMLLGTLALHAPGKKLFWDADNMRFKNSPEASALVSREYRQGWSIE